MFRFRNHLISVGDEGFLYKWRNEWGYDGNDGDTESRTWRDRECDRFYQQQTRYPRFVKNSRTDRICNNRNDAKE